MADYVCSNGHSISAKEAVDACPVYRKGSPCDGALRRIGPGSRPRPTKVEQEAAIVGGLLPRSTAARVLADALGVTR